MRKKLIPLLLIFLLSPALLFSSPWSYMYEGVEGHPEILGGILPTYTHMGANYEGWSFLENRETRLELLLGLGYTQRKIWQNPNAGSPLFDDPLVYDVVRTNWSVRLNQSLDGKNHISPYIGYEGTFEYYLDSMVQGSSRQNGSTAYPVQSIATWFSPSSVNSPYYPDLKGADTTMLGTTLVAGLSYTDMKNTLVTSDGFSSDLSFRYAPTVLNNLLDGTASFYSIDSTSRYAKTLYSLKDAKDLNVYSIVVSDKVNLNWTNGNAVPLYYQGPVSLGQKMRGFSAWTYNTQFSAVNSFDLRFSGPEPFFSGIFPRMNLFLDIGYALGNYFNSSVSYGGVFLASSGVQLAVAIFDYLDLGYQLAFLLAGHNYENYNDTIVGSVTLTLKL